MEAVESQKNLKKINDLEKENKNKLENEISEIFVSTNKQYSENLLFYCFVYYVSLNNLNFIFFQ